MNTMVPVFDYEDIQLIPNKCIINSRSEADTSVKLGITLSNFPLFQQICKQLLMKILLKC